MAKNKLAKAIHSGPTPMSPKMPKECRAEIKECENGFIVSGGYDPKTGKTPQHIAKSKEEAHEIASKLLK